VFTTGVLRIACILGVELVVFVLAGGGVELLVFVVADA
jgi:hypothetical protein